MFTLGIFIALAVSLASGLFIWACCVVGARADEAAEACWSGWEDDDPYLAEQVRAALHPVNIEEMPTPKPLTVKEGN